MTEASRKVVRRKGVMGGLPCLQGTRVPSRAIMALFQRGFSMECIAKFYGHPGIDPLSVEEAVRFEAKRRRRA